MFHIYLDTIPIHLLVLHAFDLKLTLKSAANGGWSASGSPHLSAGLPGCVPVTAHVLKGEPIIASRLLLGKSQTQPDGGEGCSVIATVIR